MLDEKIDHSAKGAGEAVAEARNAHESNSQQEQKKSKRHEIKRSTFDGRLDAFVQYPNALRFRRTHRPSAGSKQNIKTIRPHHTPHT